MKRIFSLWNRGQDDPLDPVVVVQKAMANPSARGIGSLFDAFDDIVRGEIWRRVCTAQGDSFESFGGFATAAAPHGLGITSQQNARLAREVLLQAELFAAWTEILELIARKPGRPKISANDGDLRFYTVSKAPHSRDRLLVLLKNRHPEHFHSVCVGECTPYRAAINAGEVIVSDLALSNRRRLHFGVCDLHGAGLLHPKAQKKFLRAVFRKMHVDAQCSLIANELEPRLSAGLAEKWRGRSDQGTSGS